MIVDDVVL